MGTFVTNGRQAMAGNPQSERMAGNQRQETFNQNESLQLYKLRQVTNLDEAPTDVDAS